MDNVFDFTSELLVGADYATASAFGKLVADAIQRKEEELRDLEAVRKRIENAISHMDRVDEAAE